MLLVKLAWRNVTRHIGRTSLSMISVVAGVAIIIVGRAFMGGMVENVLRAQIDSLSGHVMALPADYPTAGIQHPVDHLLTLDERTRGWLDSEAVESWTTRTLFAPRIVRGRDSIRARVYSFDPGRDEAVFPRTDWQVSGKVPSSADDGVLISRGIARILAVEAGDRLVFQARTPAGALNALDIPVAGVVMTGNPMVDRLGAFMPLPLSQKLLLHDNHFSHLTLRITDRDDSARIARELGKKLGKAARVTTWQEETAGVMRIMRLRQTMLDIIAFALMAIAAAGIANTVLMAAHERVREIGTLRALGLLRRGVVGLFVLEGVLMGGLGAILGAALGGVIMWKLSQSGIDMSSMLEAASSSGAYDSMPVSSTLYTQWSPATVVAAAMVGLLVAVLASIYPAFVASQMPPAEAVRAE